MTIYAVNVLIPYRPLDRRITKLMTLAYPKIVVLFIAAQIFDLQSANHFTTNVQVVR